MDISNFVVIVISAEDPSAEDVQGFEVVRPRPIQVPAPKPPNTGVFKIINSWGPISLASGPSVYSLLSGVTVTQKKQ